MLAVTVWAAACGSSEPDAVTGAAPAEEPSQPVDQAPAEGDQADSSAEDGGEVSDSGDRAASGSDESDDGGSSTGEDSGASSSSSSDDAEASSGASGEGSGASSSSSSDDADSSSGASSDADASGSPDDTVSVSSDQIAGDGADITDPGPSTSGGPAPPQERRQLARITDVVMQVLESWPAQVIVQVSGELPDPCHELWWEVAVDGNTYDVQVWSVSPPPDSDLVCAMMIQSFVENVPLGGGFVDEDYTVIINGEIHELNF